MLFIHGTPAACFLWSRLPAGTFTRKWSVWEGALGPRQAPWWNVSNRAVFLLTWYIKWIPKCDRQYLVSWLNNCSHIHAHKRPYCSMHIKLKAEPSSAPQLERGAALLPPELSLPAPRRSRGNGVYAVVTDTMQPPFSSYVKTPPVGNGTLCLLVASASWMLWLKVCTTRTGY